MFRAVLSFMLDRWHANAMHPSARRTTPAKPVEASPGPLTAMVFLVFATSAPLHGAIEDRDWCVTSTEHFHLVSDLPQPEALALLASLDRFRSAASALLPGLSQQSAPPLKLLVFERARDFATTFDSVTIVGFTRPSLDESLLASGPDREGRHLHRNVFHEYTHYLLRSRAALNLPIWYEEGLASYLATISVNDDGMVVVGRVPYRFLRGALVTPGITMDEIVGERFRLESAQHELSEIYGLAWALVRYLHHAKDAEGVRYASKLGSMLSAIDNGATSIDAMQSTLGLDPRGLKRQLRKYYEDDRLPVFRFRTPIAETMAFHHACLDPAQARFELAEATSFHNPEFALDLYNDILDSRPEHTGALIGLSRLVQADRALALVERARKIDPNAPEANIRLAELRVLECRNPVPQDRRRDDAEADVAPRSPSRAGPADATDGSASPCRQAFKDAVDLYGRALESPRHLGTAAYGLGIVSLAVGRPDDALRYLRTAHARAPWSPQINFYLGEAYRRTGHTERARQHFKKTAHWHPEERWRDRADESIAAMGVSTRNG